MNREKLKNLLEEKQGEIRIIRKNYWPMIYFYNNSYIFEIILIVQAFGFYNPLVFVIDDNGIQDKEKALNHCKKFQKQDLSSIDDCIQEIYRYLQFIEGIFGDNPPDRIIRISSLYDIDIEKFNSISEFVDFLIETIGESYRIFGKKYKQNLENTSEMQVIKNNVYPPLKFPKNLTGNYITNFNNHKIIFKIIPGYSPCGLMYVFGLESEIDNYFFFISVYFYQKSPVLSCIQYNFVNIGKNINQEICLYDETKDNIITPLERRDEHIFINNLKNIFSDNPTKVFVKICIESLKNLGYQNLLIINPIENKWLMEHNQDRTKESLIKSGKNLYTNIGLDIGGKLTNDGRIIL